MLHQPTLRPITRKLTDTKVKAAKPKKDGKPLNLTDGGGLYLHVKPSGKSTGKYWRFCSRHRATIRQTHYPARRSA